jgi:hypothetical protein
MSTVEFELALIACAALAVVLIAMFVRAFFENV